MKNIYNYSDGENVALVGDLLLATAIDSLMSDRTGIVETGTYLGYTSKWFMESYRRLPFFTVEVNPEYATKAMTLNNVRAIQDNSAKVLPMLDVGVRPFYFLDAHWEKQWPLENELQWATGFKDPIICVHDFDDKTGAAFDPHNDMNGPVGRCLAGNDKLAVYRLKGYHRIGVAVIMAKWRSSEWLEEMPI